ncbi:hypothetical protein Tco_1097359 [Tanacetum coccineum]
MFLRLAVIAAKSHDLEWDVQAVQEMVSAAGVRMDVHIKSVTPPDDIACDNFTIRHSSRGSQAVAVGTACCRCVAADDTHCSGSSELNFEQPEQKVQEEVMRLINKQGDLENEDISRHKEVSDYLILKVHLSSAITFGMYET